LRRDPNGWGSPFESPSEDGAIAFLELSQDLWGQGKAEEARAAARKALERKEDYPEALYFSAKLLADRGQMEDRQEAERLLWRLLGVDALHARGRHLLGCLCFGQGRHQEAFEHLSLASRLEPGNSEALNDLGVVQGTLGMLDDSLTTFLQARARDQENALIWSNGAQVLKALGHIPQAQEWQIRAETAGGGR